VCGARGRFERDRLSVSESYRCASCGGALRYQSQARTIVRLLGVPGTRSLAELSRQSELGELEVFEPGTLGPFRRYLRTQPHYHQSFYDPTAAPGEVRDGLPYEDLMALSFETGSIDLVITSDILEHVREPARAFREIYRVLRPGGAHVFTIPVRWPMRAATVARVDVSGPDDVPILPAVYHGTSLVYNDFGTDLLDLLDEVGFVTEPDLFPSGSATTAVQVTFCSVHPVRVEELATTSDPVGDRSDPVTT